MSASLIYTIITICSIGITASVILYFAAKKFQVHEDPRIDEVEEVLPSANCGGCGYTGCRAFAESIVKENKLENKFCPVGGNECMSKVADIMDLVAEVQAPRVAVVRCNGACENRPKTSNFEGVHTCSIASMSSGGETNCQFGCLGYGDCCTVCDFDALHMNQLTGLPEVQDDKCVACGACVNACPKKLIELRKKMPKNRKVYVSCRNTDKGAVAAKACKVSCISCGKCQKECAFDAIVIENNLAYINSDKCTLCRKCVVVCPTNSIIEENFPPRKEKPVGENVFKKVEV